MNFGLEIKMNNLYDEEIRKNIKDLSYMFLDEIFKGNKVAFYYENIKTGDVISFNENICFYAASTIKILIVVMMLEKVLNNEYLMDEKILIKMQDLKQDTGILKYQKKDTYYSIEELMKLTIVESDNTAYLKLVDILKKENVKKYGKKLGAKYTMTGKETDSFGIIDALDMKLYLKKVKSFIDENNKYSILFKNWLLNPSVKIIKDESINNKQFIRKYGSYDIAYHEVGYVLDENPYYLIILTQLNNFDYKEKFINDAAKKILKIHSNINERG